MSEGSATEDIRFATGLTVRKSNPDGGEISRVTPNWSWGPPNLLQQGYQLIKGVKAAGKLR